MAGIRQSVMITDEQKQELVEKFQSLDSDKDGTISHDELHEALKVLGIPLAQYQVRDLIAQVDTGTKDGKLSFDEFQAIYAELKDEHDLGRKFRKTLDRKEDVDVIGGMSESSNPDTQHSVRKEEMVAFSNWINRNLKDDPDCQSYLPMDEKSGDLYVKCKDGILLCKMINKSCPDTIDERAINKGKISTFQVTENQTLAINSARAIGCNVVNIGPQDLKEGKPHLVLGMLWQIIRIGLLSDINLHENPNLAVLLREGEEIEDLMKLSPEQLLIRWVNYHLERAPGCDRQIANFGGDIKDSIAYIHLLGQIAPKEAGVNIMAEHIDDKVSRAEAMLVEAEKIECRSFVTANDVVSGNTKLNLAFAANLYNRWPALESKDPAEYNIIPETREEKMYRNWMNSMGVSPYVNHLYTDLGDGLVIFQLYDIIAPGTVDWDRVHQKFHKLRVMMEKLENCNYAVELGKKVKFSLVGIDGKDLMDGTENLTLALVWQLMKAYTLSILTKLNDGNRPVVDKEIVTWVNDTLKASGKSSSITNFSDPNIGTGVVVLDVVDALKPGSVKYDLVHKGSTGEEKLKNAKLAISMARKIGARVYALPEDIVEVKPKMVMTVFACLMIKGKQNPLQQSVE